MPVNSTLGVNFFTRPKRNNPNKLDIYLRITVNKKRSEMSIKRDIDIKDWDILRVKAKETSVQLITLNSYMNDMKAEILNAHKEPHAERKVNTAKAIKLKQSDSPISEVMKDIRPVMVIFIKNYK